MLTLININNSYKHIKKILLFLKNKLILYKNHTTRYKICLIIKQNKKKIKELIKIKL